MSNHKLGVCVPYRDRELHLNEFIPKVGKHLKNQGIDFQMYFCHQVDDKLFNRGATKNIAAKHAFEDGCDYIVWHDIDMIPEEGTDYSYPGEFPLHIATQISQMGYQLKYHEYFGGAVLFTKEQVEATNGYSNNYWDWGMEDDDLFWRCHLEKMTNTSFYNTPDTQKDVISFNGNDSWAKLPSSREIKSYTAHSHTVSILTRAYQQPEKNSVYLIGDSNRKYVEYPILRVPGYDYGISFNNSRAFSFIYWNAINNNSYMWAKRYDKQWTWITAVIDNTNRLSHLYINGQEVDSEAGLGSKSPSKFIGRLKRYFKDTYLGYTPSLPEGNPGKYFKGDIADLRIWDRALTPEDVSEIPSTVIDDGLIYELDLENIELNNCEITKQNIQIPNSIIPHRRPGRMRCLPHEDEGIVDGKFVKGATTAKNERRYILEMQDGKADYKKDGIKQVQYELVGEEKLTPWAKMINIKL